MNYIYVISNKVDLQEELENSFRQDKNIKIKGFEKSQFHKIINNIPDTFVIDEDSLESDNILDYIQAIRDDESNAITPIIVISSNIEKVHILDVLKKDVELYIEKPIDSGILYYNIRNILRLLNSNRTVSPLTGLPGNVQIQAEMQKRLQAGKDFAMLYADLDNFKAYNDTYGFSKGDELIKLTAKVLTSNVFKEEDEYDSENFVGHIGGDDFIAIVENGDYEKICQNIVAQFDAEISKCFTKEDFERGYMEVENRKGILEQFPLTTISIGVVDVTKERFNNTLEIGEAGAAVKHLAKTIYGSTYVIDRRRNRDKYFKNSDDENDSEQEI